MFDDWEELKRLCPEVADAAKAALDGMPTGTWLDRRARRLKFGPVVVAEVKRVKLDWNVIQNNPLYKSIKISRSTPSLEYLNNLSHVDRVNNLTALQSL